MISSENTIWMSAHLFYAEPWEDFITGRIIPLVDELKRKDLVRQFFFIRYWEGGPHIRFRLQGEQNTIENEVRPYVDHFFKSHFSHFPSATPALSEETTNYPNNSVQFIPYEPETERYGGPQALSLAEEHFQLSSIVVSQLFSSSVKWDHASALTAAIQLHLAFAHAAGFTQGETAYLFSLLFKGVALNSLNIPQDSAPDAISDKRYIRLLGVMSEKFLPQRDALASYHENIWRAFDENGCAAVENQVLELWYRGSHEIATKLSTLQEKGDFIPIPEFRFNANEPISKEKQQLMLVYASYIHMTNNRLGIIHLDESYLAYLIMKSLQQLLLRHE